MKLTASQLRNLCTLYLFPEPGAVNGNTWPGLQRLGLVENDRLSNSCRCTQAGARIARKEIDERLRYNEHPGDLTAALRAGGAL